MLFISFYGLNLPFGVISFYPVVFINSFSIYCKAGLLSMNFPINCLPGMILFYLLFWSIVLLDIKFLIEIIFLPALCIWVHCILDSIVWMGNQLLIVLMLPFMWWVIFFCFLPFLRFIFVFDLKQFDYNVCGSFLLLSYLISDEPFEHVNEGFTSDLERF